MGASALIPAEPVQFFLLTIAWKCAPEDNSQGLARSEGNNNSPPSPKSTSFSRAAGAAAGARVGAGAMLGAIATGALAAPWSSRKPSNEGGGVTGGGARIPTVGRAALPNTPLRTSCLFVGCTMRNCAQEVKAKALLWRNQLQCLQVLGCHDSQVGAPRGSIAPLCCTHTNQMGSQCFAQISRQIALQCGVHVIVSRICNGIVNCLWCAFACCCPTTSWHNSLRNMPD